MIDNNEMPNGSSLASVAPILSERVKQLQLAGRLDGEKGASSSNAWLPWILCVMMTIVYASAGLRYYRNNPTATTGSPTVAPSSLGATSVAKKDTPKPSANDTSTNAPKGNGYVVPNKGLEALLESKGYIIPAHQISVSPIEVSGRVVELNLEEGMTFKTGEILAKIEDIGFRADFEESKAQLLSLKEKLREMTNGNRPEEIESVRAELGEAEANLKAYKAEWQRYQGKNVEAISTKDFDTVESSYRGGEQRVLKLRKNLQLMIEGTRVERIAQADADVKAAEARLSRAKWKLDNCIIRSPVNGVVLSKKAEYGSLINPVVGGVSTSLCEIADLSDLEIDMEIQERDISKIRDGQHCELRSDAYPDRKYEGYVDRAMPIGNRARGIIPIRVKVILPSTEQQGQFLKPEMAVSVTFFNRKSEKWKGRTLPSPSPNSPTSAVPVAPVTKIEPKKEGGTDANAR